MSLRNEQRSERMKEQERVGHAVRDRDFIARRADERLLAAARWRKDGSVRTD